MRRRNLTVARLAEDEIESIEIEDAFGDLLCSCSVALNILLAPRWFPYRQ
jgi:hypothetical protein